MVVYNVQWPRLMRRPDLHHIRRVVTNKILWTSADVDVPAVLLESDSTVVVPVMNKGHQPVTLGVEKALVALDEAQCINNLVATQEYLRTDHVSVKYWKTMQTGMPDTIQQWVQHMSTYNLIMEYRPEKQHGNADGLSRPPEIDICGRRGCICATALANIRCWASESSDGEP
jgi:hypothetical protein